MAAADKYLQLFRFAGLLRTYRWSLAAVVATRIATISIGMVAPLSMRFLIDEVVPGRDWQGFTWISVALAVILAASLCVALFSAFIAMRLEQRIAYDLKRTLQRKWERLPLGYFQQWGVGEHIYRCTTDVNNVTAGLARVLPEIVGTHLQFVLFLGIAATLHLELTLWFVASLPLTLAIEVFHSKAMRPIQAEAQTVAASVNDTIGQYASSVMTVKLFHREKFASRRYVAALSRLVRLALTRWQVDSRYQSLGFCAGTVWGWGVILYGFTLVMRGEVTLGTLIALKLYLTALARPVQEIGGLIQSIVLGSVSAERVQHTLTALEEPRAVDVRPAKPALQPRPTGVEFDGVTFGYQDGAAVLMSVTATLPGTGLTGITGPSGAGKTTLVALMARLYEPRAGSILVDGRDIRAWAPSAIRERMTIVPQETFLFTGTIEENIAYGARHASTERIERAARFAEAHDFILGLRDGYQTRIAPSGAGLSLGQRQRIGLARALVRDSSTLVLDEGLNSIDELVRERIVHNLSLLARTQSVLFITHELQSLQRCDRVFVVIDGQVIDTADGAGEHYRHGFMQYLRLKRQYERSPARA